MSSGVTPGPLLCDGLVITEYAWPELLARYLKDRWSLRGPHLVPLARFRLEVRHDIVHRVLTGWQCLFAIRLCESSGMGHVVTRSLTAQISIALCAKVWGA